MGRASRHGHCSEHGKHFTRHRSPAKFITSPSEETEARGSGGSVQTNSAQRETERERGGRASGRECVCIRLPSQQQLYDRLQLLDQTRSYLVTASQRLEKPLQCVSA